MSHLAPKSHQNLEAAEMLIAGKNYAPSVHCSYYSFLQFSLDIILNHAGIDSNRLIQKHSFKKQVGLHAAIRAELKERISRKNRYDYPGFNKSFNILKKQREDSDYQDVAIGEHEALTALRLCKELKLMLKDIGI
jgi:uncharacterized protein (UPF0332 family)